MHKFRYAKLWLILGWLLVALIIFLSLYPKPPQPLEFEQSDKVSHILAYMILMLWFANIYPQRSSQLQLSIGFFVMGVCLELLQGMTQYRTFSYIDMLANGLGILLALYLAKTRLATYLLRLDTWLNSIEHRA
ncbi:MAG: VanZ family protein [Deltaproteobacteria bacterium]|nr:VanZ family protein [Deltaproteobacteria bacterium]